MHELGKKTGRDTGDHFEAYAPRASATNHLRSALFSTGGALRVIKLFSLVAVALALVLAARLPLVVFDLQDDTV